MKFVNENAQNPLKLRSFFVIVNILKIFNITIAGYVLRKLTKGGELMAFDEIAGISAAEESVRLGIAEAQAEAKRIVAQAELAGKTDVEQARDKAAKELAARRAEAQAEADKEAQEIYQKAENKKAVLRAKAESRCAAAAKLIAERIVNG